MAEVLRRRFFNPESVSDRGNMAAARDRGAQGHRGAGRADGQARRGGRGALPQELPVPPGTDGGVLRQVDAGIERFQRTRGVLRTFALALREAEKWDESPAGRTGRVPERARSRRGCPRRLGSWCRSPTPIVSDGQATRWTGIVESELACARQVQTESVGLKLREIEQAVDGDVPAFPADRAQCQDPRSDAADRPVPAGQDRVGEGPGALGAEPVTGSTTRTCRRRKASCRPNGGWAIART